jgi:hypothetical protein
MKLWKMNAILIILSLSLCSCTELTLKSHSHKLDAFEEAYAENEKYLSSIEGVKKPQVSEISKMEEAAAEDTDHSFLEKPGQKILKKGKKQIKSSKFVKSSKSPSILSKKLQLPQTVKRFEAQQALIEQGRLIQLRKIPNPKIKTQDARYIKFEKCNKKTGYLNLVKDMSKLPMELGVTPIFASLSLSSFNLFLSAGDDKTLFNTVKLKNILWISQQKMLTGLNCFEVVHGDVLRGAGEFHKQSITLCAKDNFEMQQWIDAVGAFKECQVNVHNIDHNRVVIADFQKVNELLKESQGKGFGIGSGSNGANPYSSLYYDNNPTVQKNTQKVQKDTAIKSEISKIVNFIKEGNIQQNKVARKMQNQLKEAKKFSEEVHQKQEIIRKILEKRVEKEKIRKQNMMKMEEKHKELELLKAVENRIMQMKKQEIKRFSNTFESQIEEERRKAENESKEMMRTLIQEEKLTPYNDCTDPRLMFFEDKKYVSQLCFRYYGEHVSNYRK